MRCIPLEMLNFLNLLLNAAMYMCKSVTTVIGNNDNRSNVTESLFYYNIYVIHLCLACFVQLCVAVGN